jgi:hypothetical protein
VSGDRARAAHLAEGAARCTPQRCRCPQQTVCARANDWPVAANGKPVPADDVLEVDASICLRAGWCPMFIDRRGVRLLEAA